MSTDGPDYRSIAVPQRKRPEDYDYLERRAEIYNLIREAGSPHAIAPQKQLAEYYDVSESTISKDMKRLKQYIIETEGESVAFDTRVRYEKTVNELQQQGEWKKAWDVMMEYNEWLFDAGFLERAPDKQDISMEVEAQATEAYEVIPVDSTTQPKSTPQSSPDAGPQQLQDSTSTLTLPVLEDGEGEADDDGEQ